VGRAGGGKACTGGEDRLGSEFIATRAAGSGDLGQSRAPAALIGERGGGEGNGPLTGEPWRFAGE
jgi:hypothetical protein